MWYICHPVLHVLSFLVTSFLYAYLSIMHFLFYTVYSLQFSLVCQLCFVLSICMYVLVHF